MDNLQISKENHFFFTIGKLHMHVLSFEFMTSPSIQLSCKKEVSFELELIDRSEEYLLNQI